MIRIWHKHGDIYLLSLSHRDAGVVFPAIMRVAADRIPEDELSRNTQLSACELEKTAEDFLAIVRDNLAQDCSFTGSLGELHWSPRMRKEPGSWLTADVYLHDERILLGVDRRRLEAMIWIMCRLAADFDDVAFLEIVGCNKTEVLSLALDAQLLLEVLQECEG